MRRPYSPRKGKNDHERLSLQVCWGAFPSRVFWAEKQRPVLKIWRKKRHGNLKRTRVAWADVKTRPAESRQRGPERCGSWLRNTRPGEEASGWLAWLSLFSPALLGVLWYCLVYYSLPSISSECRALNRFLSCFILRVVMLCAINICPLPDYWKRCNGGTHRGSLIRGHARLTGPAGRAVGTMTEKKKKETMGRVEAPGLTGTNGTETPHILQLRTPPPRALSSISSSLGLGFAKGGSKSGLHAQFAHVALASQGMIGSLLGGGDRAARASHVLHPAPPDLVFQRCGRIPELTSFRFPVAGFGLGLGLGVMVGR